MFPVVSRSGYVKLDSGRGHGHPASSYEPSKNITEKTQKLIFTWKLSQLGLQSVEARVIPWEKEPQWSPAVLVEDSIFVGACEMCNVVITQVLP